MRYSLSHDPSGDSAGIALFGQEDEVAARLAVLDDQAIEDDLIERVRREFGVLVLPTRQPD